MVRLQGLYIFRVKGTPRCVEAGRPDYPPRGIRRFREERRKVVTEHVMPKYICAKDLTQWRFIRKVRLLVREHARVADRVR